MRVGNISGIETVYDGDGNPVLERGEEILRESAGDDLMVIKDTGRFLGETVIDTTKERGILYLTNKRLIFVRTPDAWLKARTYGNIAGLGTAAAEAARAKELVRRGAREYVELSYSEVRGFKAWKNKWMDLYVRDDSETQFRVLLRRKNRKDDKLALLESLLLSAGAQRFPSGRFFASRRVPHGF